MSVDTTVAVLYAQSGLANNANVAMVAPQASLAMSRVLAAEAARQEREQVLKAEKAEDPNINAREEGGGFFYSRRQRRRTAVRETETGEVLATTPYTGNLLNVKV